jgi:hypothetical protein
MQHLMCCAKRPHNTKSFYDSLHVHTYISVHTYTYIHTYIHALRYSWIPGQVHELEGQCAALRESLAAAQRDADDLAGRTRKALEKVRNAPDRQVRLCVIMYVCVHTYKGLSKP